MSKTLADTFLLLHIVAAIAWIGPALGAWSFYLRRKLWVEREPGPREPVDDWVVSELLRVLAIEHFAFILLISSGMARAYAVGLTHGNALSEAAPLWFRMKLWTVALLVIPFEVFDVYLAHWLLPRAMAERRENPEAFEASLKKHDQVVWFGSVVLGFGIPLILYSVTFRPI